MSVFRVSGSLRTTKVWSVTGFVGLVFLCSGSLGAESPRTTKAAVEESEAAAAAAAAAAKNTRVDASRGGVTFESENNSLTVGARLQFRWAVDDRQWFDADVPGTDGFGRADGASSQFDDPRMRLTLSGGAFQPWLKYAFQFELSRTSGDNASKIKDAIIEIRPVGRNYSVMMGQFKAPFGLQQLTSSGRQQFVDRAITDSKFTPGRDMGILLSGTAAGRKLGYAGGAFNGAGESRLQNNRGQLWVGRVYFNPFGQYRLAEGASEGPDRPQLHLGFGARTGKQIRGRTATGVFENPNNQTAYDVELAFKALRFYGTAEYFAMRDEQRNPIADRDVNSQGYHAQIGFMLVPRTVELGLRYAEVEADKDIDNAKLREIRGVFGYYWRSHNLKLQADVGQVRYDKNYGSLSSLARSGLPGLGPRLVTGESLGDLQFRMQMQVAF